MALFVVERDLSSVPPERLRLDQRDIATICLRLKAEGKRIRYISSAVMPVDGRAVDLFGADSADLVRQAHVSAAVPYSRITEVLDVTPSYLHRGTSRSRHSLQRAVGGLGDVLQRNRSEAPSAVGASADLARWLTDGPRFFAMCLEAVEQASHLLARNETLERESSTLREDLDRLRHCLHVLEADRDEVTVAINELIGRLLADIDRLLERVLHTSKSGVCRP